MLDVFSCALGWPCLRREVGSTVIPSNLTHSVILGKPRPSHNTKYSSPFPPPVSVLTVAKAQNNSFCCHYSGRSPLRKWTSAFLFPSNIHHGYLTLFCFPYALSPHARRFSPTPVGGSLTSSSFLLLLALSAAYPFPQRIHFPLFFFLNGLIHSSLHRASRISTEKSWLYTKT